jgi:hypothetical protein
MLRQYYPLFYTKWILSISFEMERILFQIVDSEYQWTLNARIVIEVAT